MRSDGTDLLIMESAPLLWQWLSQQEWGKINVPKAESCIAPEHTRATVNTFLEQFRRTIHWLRMHSMLPFNALYGFCNFIFLFVMNVQWWSNAAQQQEKGAFWAGMVKLFTEACQACTQVNSQGFQRHLIHVRQNHGKTDRKPQTSQPGFQTKFLLFV